MAFKNTTDVDVVKVSPAAEPSGIALSPAVGASNLIISTSQALALAAHNATAQQHQSFLAAQATLMQAVLQLYQPAPEPPPKVFA